MSIVLYGDLSRRKAQRLVKRLHVTALRFPDILGEVLQDLPDADIDVLCGILEIVKGRIRDHGRQSSVV